MNLANAAAFLLVFGTALAASWAGVALFRGWSVRRDLLDVPNDRSSHSVPTPRGGGLIIVTVSLIGYAGVSAGFGAPFSLGYFFGALIIAGVSWFDDLYSLPFWSRLIAHILAAVLLIADLGYWHDVLVPLVSATLPLGDLIGVVITVGWVVWLINAYNFMDGIDGIAALQASIAALAWSLLASALGLPGTFLFAGVLTCASMGFLIHNWQPAKIFMGDVGSAFLGYTLAALPLLARSEAKAEMPFLPVIGVLFVWFFVFDTVVTLMRRIFARKRIWEAHREHIYQKMVIEGMSHSTVTTIYGAFATLLSLSLVFALIFSGLFSILALFLLIIPTFLIGYFGVRKKH